MGAGPKGKALRRDRGSGSSLVKPKITYKLRGHGPRWRRWRRRRGRVSETTGEPERGRGLRATNSRRGDYRYTSETMNATCHTLSFGSCGGMVVASSMVWETVSGRCAYPYRTARRHEV